MDNGISFLSDFCETHLLQEKIFIVPSYQTGHQIGEALTKAGYPWVNLRFVTLPSLALEIAGTEMSSRGLKQISGTTSRVLINHIFRELKEEQTLIYYGQLEAQSGIIDAIFRSIRDLRAAGIRSADLRPDQFIDEDKGRETQLFLKKYEEELEEGKFFDTAQLYAVVSDTARKNPIKPERFYLCLENQIFSKVERDFLDSLTKDLILVPQGEVEEMPRPQRMIPLQKEIQKAAKPGTDLERAPWLFALTKAPAPFKDNTMQMFQAIGPTNECREVIRRIIKEKTPFDQVEIIHPAGSAYPSIFHVLSEKTGLKFSSGEGLLLNFTTPGKVFSGIIQWMENNYPVTDFCALLESESLKVAKGKKGMSLSPLKVSRVLKEAKIGWGKGRYVQRLEALYKEKKKESESEGEDADSVKEIYKIMGWIRTIMELFPSWDETEKIDIEDLCSGISVFLKKYCRVRDKREGEALGMITSRLDEASSFKTIPFSKDEAIEWLLSTVGHLRVGSSGPMPAHIHLASFQGGGYSGRPYTFIAGLDQASIPGSRLPDPILLDEEREAISGELAVTSDRLRENLYSMTSLLSSLWGQAVLSFSSYDVIEKRQSFPSSFLLQVHRLIEGDAVLDYSSLMEALGDSSGFIPSSEVKVDEIDWWLDFVAGEGKFKNAVKSIKGIFPFISQGDYALSMREGPDLCSYDGIVVISDDECHPCRNLDLAMSASRIEKLARCPYSYFLRYVLGIMPPDEIILDKAQWLDGLQRGSLLHEVFCVFMKGLRDRGEALSGEKQSDEIRAVAESVILQYREENPPPSEAVFEREKEEIFATLDIFLIAEEKREQKVEPLLFEVNFGFKGDEGEGIAESVTLELSQGVSFRLNGRIDRIDRIGKGNFKVIDYKTGSYAPYESIKAFGKGKYLQHVLYAEAAEKILKDMKIDPSPRVSVSGYAFPTRKGDGREILIENFDRGRLRELLAELFLILERGHFLVNPKATCDFCDYGVVCGKGVIERTKDKIETNAGEFSFFDRLEEYE